MCRRKETREFKKKQKNVLELHSAGLIVLQVAQGFGEPSLAKCAVPYFKEIFAQNSALFGTKKVNDSLVSFLLLIESIAKNVSSYLLIKRSIRLFGAIILGKSLSY